MFGVFAVAIYGFAALVVGAVQFLLCVAVPRLRKYALSAAAWWVVFGVCFLGISLSLMIGGGIAIDRGWLRAMPRWSAWGTVAVACLVAAVVATAAARVHQAIVRRFTFALFRLYATGVVAGIGSVFGWCLAIACLAHPFPYAWVFAICGVGTPTIVFGYMAGQHAGTLRGGAPERWAWATPEEFARDSRRG